MTIRIRKKEAGDASGHDDGTGRKWRFDWPEDGAVIPVPHAVAVELLRNPEWGFSEAGEDDAEATSPAKEDEGDDATAKEPAADGSEAVEEPKPKGEEFSESPAPRKTAAKAADKPAKKAAAPAASPAKE